MDSRTIIAELSAIYDAAVERLRADIAEYARSGETPAPESRHDGSYCYPELRVRFCGYDTTRYKLFAWTFSAMLCGLAGALYVPQVGIINPSEMQPSNSIEMAIWVAVGGRATLLGGVLGAWIVNGAKSWLTVAFPSAWLYFLGALFILVTLFLPHGLTGLRAAVVKLPKLMRRAKS